MKRTTLMLAAVGIFVLAQAALAEWTPSRRLSGTSGGSYAPSMAVYSSGNLLVFWIDSTPGNYEVYQNRTTDGGTTWAKSQRLTWTSSGS